MAFTLAQAKELSQDKLTNFVIDEFRQSPLMDAMVWDDIIKPQGGESFTYSYNRVTTLPTAAGRALNTEYVPQEAATTQEHATAKIFGGSFQIDRALQAHERQVLNLVEFQVQQKTKAARALYNDWFINGDTAVDVTAFDGLDKALTGSSTERIPTAVIDLSSAAAIEANYKAFLYEFRQTLKLMDGSPTVIMVSGDMFAAFQTVVDFTTQFQMGKNDLGTEVIHYGTSTIMKMGDKPGTSDSIIATDTSVGNEGESGIYFTRLALDGVHSVTPDGMTAPKIYLPNMTVPGAVKTGEVEMIAAVVMKSTRSAAILRKIKVQ